MKWRILSVVLTLSMILSMLPVTVWAAETESDETTEAAVSSDAVEPSETTAEDAVPPDAAEVTEAIAEDAVPSDDDVEAPKTAVEEVQALIDALPSAADVRAMDTDGRRAAYGQTQTAYDAYKALSEAQRGLVTGADVFEALFAFFNGQTMPLATASVSYVNAQGQSQTNVTATVVESGTTTWSSTTTNGWYVVNSNVTINGRITVSGTVNLILADGYTLTASSGITVSGSNALIIWGQSGQKGTLKATGKKEAGIGGVSGGDGGNITINGGIVTATSSDYGAGIGGGANGGNGSNITINGGTVTATAYGGAGIGGGTAPTDDSGKGGAGRNITINGGTVTAASNGSVGGAGIGGGGSGSTANNGGDANSITIKGGTVTATASYNAPGIGGGRGIKNGGSCSNITISGGTVTATGDGNAAGIGGGDGNDKTGSVSSITITGGTVTATGGSGGRAIGAAPNFGNSSYRIYGNTDRNMPSETIVTNPDWNALRWVKIMILSTESLTVTPPAFDAVTYGYATQPAAKAITFSGNPYIQNVTISGSDFILSGSGSSWTVQPKASLNAGTHEATITATYLKGTSEATATATVRFVVNKADQSALSITGTKSSVTYGDTFTLSTSGGSGNGGVTWSVSPSGYATVSSSGVVNAIAATTSNVTITATKADDGNYNVKTATWSFTISRAAQAAPSKNDIRVSKSSDSITVTSPTGLSAVGTEHQYFVGTAPPSETDWSNDPHFGGLNPRKEYTVYVRYGENANYFASTYVTVTASTLGEGDSATLLPGESVKVGDVTVTNDGDRITITDGSGNITTVTPVPAEGVEVDVDGNVTVPKNGRVKTGDGPERILPDGGTVSGDGTVSADEIVMDGVTVKGDGVTADKDGNTTFPEGGSAEVGDTTVTVPKGGTLKPNRNGTVNVPNGSTVTFPEGPEMALPEGGLVNGNGTVTADEIVVGGITVKGDDVTVGSDGTIHVPEDGTVTPPGGPDITLPGGGTVHPDGSVTPKGGSAQIGDTTVKVEDGGTLEPDGKGGVEVPEGSTVTPPGGPDIKVGPDNGGTVDKDGNVTLPEGGSATIGGGDGDGDEDGDGDDGASVTVPKEGGTLKPDGNGNVTVPGGSTVVDGEGKEHKVPPQGGTVSKDGTYKDNPIPSSGNTGSFGGNGGSDFVSTNTVTVSQAKHGKVTVRPTSASSGQIVTITVTPDEGYVLSKLTVTDSRGNELTLTDKGDGVYTFIMPFGGITVEAIFVPWTGGETETNSPAPAFSPASAFSDLNPDAWYWDAVDYVILNGLMNGYGYRDRTFGPNDTLSRAMLAQVLYNQIGRPGVNGNILLADASSGAWYTDAITWAATNEIIYGYGKSEYGPDDPVTREQFAVMLYRFEQSRGGGFAGEWTPDYPDASEISEYAVEAVTWCAVNGILSGYDDGALRPRGNATRAETAVMLMRFLSL